MELFLGSRESDLVPWGRDLDPEYPRGEGESWSRSPSPFQEAGLSIRFILLSVLPSAPGMHSKRISPQAGGFSPLLGVPAVAVTQT